MKYILSIFLSLVILLSGCVTYYPSPYADRGNQIRYKYSFELVKCDFCHTDTFIYKIVNGKKKMCDVCFSKIRFKIR